MKRQLTVIAFLLGAANALDAQRARFTPSVFRDTTLENGLQIIAVRNPTAPMATIMVAIRGGAFTQNAEAVEGIPHFIEHLLFKSSSTFDREVGAMGGGANGTTSEEMVNYFITAPSKNVSHAIKSLADLVRSPKFRDEDLKTEVQVVRNELQRFVADQRYLLDFTVNQALWGPDFSRKNVGGNAFALLRATPQSLEALYKQFYTPNNAALVVSGDIVIAEVFATAKQAFKDWKKGPAAPTQAVAFKMTPLAATKVLPAVDATSSDVTLRIAWHGPSAQTDPAGATAASLFAAYINNPNSTFQRQLVDAGLVQAVQLSYQLLNYVGPIELTVRTTPDKLAEATTALQRELARLADPQSFTEEDLHLAKKSWRVESAIEWERGTSFAHEVAAHWSVAGVKSFLDYGDGIAARTVPEVREFVQKYIAGKPKVVGVLITPLARQTLGRTYQTAMGSWYTR